MPDFGIFRGFSEKSFGDKLFAGQTPTQLGGGVEQTTDESGWVRPSDWLPMPTGITSNDEIFVGLHAVIENNDNYVAFLFTTSTAGQYQVDWGDGTVTLHNSNTAAEYEYNFDTYDVNNTTLCSRGYKQTIITVTPVTGVFRICNFQRRYTTTPAQSQPYSTGFLDIILSMPNASTGSSITFGGATVRHSYVERVEIKTIGGTTILTAFFQNCFSLQSVLLLNTQNVTGVANMFNSCFSLQSVPFFNTQNVTNMGSMFVNCYSLQSVPLINTQNVTTMNNMFSSCLSLNSIPALSTQSITTISGTDFGANFANNCNSLSRCQMVFARTVSVANCQLSRDAIVEIFNNLVDRSSTTSATITITGNWGVGALSAADLAIATNKNWVVTT